MSNNKLKSKAKRAAYAEKKEQEGRNVINWIFGILILLAIMFVAYTVIIVG